MHKFFSMYLFLFITLYIFRARRAHHQERQIVSIQPLLTVILCWWPRYVHKSRPPAQSDSYQRLYWYNLSLLVINTVCSKHVESYKQKINNIERNLCVTLVIYQESLHDARSKKCKKFKKYGTYGVVFHFFLTWIAFYVVAPCSVI